MYHVVIYPRWGHYLFYKESEKSHCGRLGWDSQLETISSPSEDITCFLGMFLVVTVVGIDMLPASSG